MPRARADAARTRGCRAHALLFVEQAFLLQLQSSRISLIMSIEVQSFLMWESHSAQSFYILHAWCARMPRTGADAARAAVCGTSVSFQRYLTVMMPIGVQVFLCVRSYSAQSFYTSCLTRAVAARAAFCGTGVSFAVTILKDNLNRGSTVSWREKVILQVDKRERLTKTKTQPKAREKRDKVKEGEAGKSPNPWLANFESFPWPNEQQNMRQRAEAPRVPSGRSTARLPSLTAQPQFKNARQQRFEFLICSHGCPCLLVV